MVYVNLFCKTTNVASFLQIYAYNANTGKEGGMGGPVTEMIKAGVDVWRDMPSDTIEACNQ